MAMRLSELHPSLVHFPITLFPLAVGADLLGRLTGNERLHELGRAMMPLAAGSAMVAAAAGVIAQEEVKAEGEAHDLLVTHRNLNLGVVGLTTAMAAWRVTHERPSAGYLALGLLGLATVSYTAYLGGHMVYELGVGVEAADGVRRPEGSPELTPGNAGEAVRAAVQDVERGIPHAIEEVANGDIAPALTRRTPEGGDLRDQST